MAIELAEAQEPSGATGPDSLVTVSRTMAIIELLATERRGLTLSEIARQLEVNKSIALRILSTLEESNYLFRGVANQKYFLSYKLSRIGLSVLVANRFMEQVQPRLRQLADACGELVLLAIIEEEGPQWVMAARGDAGRRLQVDPMIHSSLHSTATGKAWLAMLTDDEVERRVGSELPQATPFTIASLPALLDNLAEIRQQGFSISDQENELGIKAISVPVYRSRGDAASENVGFVSITAPVSRADAEDYRRFSKLLVDAAKHLGDMWPPEEASDFGPFKPRLGFQILD